MIQQQIHGQMQPISPQHDSPAMDSPTPKQLLYEEKYIWSEVSIWIHSRFITPVPIPGLLSLISQVFDMEPMLQTIATVLIALSQSMENSMCQVVIFFGIMEHQ